MEVADLGHNRRGDNEGNSAHGLDGLNCRRWVPARQEIGDLSGQPLDPRFGIGHSVDIVLEHDLCAGCWKRTVVSQRQ